MPAKPLGRIFVLLQKAIRRSFTQLDEVYGDIGQIAKVMGVRNKHNLKLVLLRKSIQQEGNLPTRNLGHCWH
ncbi:hypothetical protein N9I19_14680 [Peribacillus sp. CSMR9]|nr:hypothetical protein [Peribacillus sp. CSMR9]